MSDYRYLYFSYFGHTHASLIYKTHVKAIQFFVYELGVSSRQFPLYNAK